MLATYSQNVLNLVAEYLMKPELMAPVGNWTMLKAAIDAGADAVYFGVKKLNMRANAQNFSLQELPMIVSLCHKNGVKAYLTVNSIVFEDELADVERILEAAKKAGIDSVICWDMSVVSIAKGLAIPITLSTQASVSNSESARLYKSFGVKRIVLARECSLKQIKEVIKKTGLEVEVFVHGAMCLSVSGRCFLSHHAFGSSANRGECKQPCRSEYEIRDPDRGNSFIIGKDYVMSPKDLCTIEFVDKLIKSGIHSFKIEGRKRSPEYVSTVVSAYREAIDLFFVGKLTNKKKKELLEKLKSVYNRGLSSGFYFGRPSGDDYSKTVGSVATTRKISIGKIKNFYKEPKVIYFKLEYNRLKLGDKIIIQGPTTGSVEHEVKEMKVNDKTSKIANKGEMVSIPLEKHARRNDMVFLVRGKAHIDFAKKII